MLAEIIILVWRLSIKKDPTEKLVLRLLKNEGKFVECGAGRRPR